MTDNIKKFFEYLSEQDDEAKDNICKMEKEELIAFAANQGFTLTNEDFENPEGEVSLDEAEAVAGGGECNCIVGGGGTGSTSSTGEDIPCACIAAGAGEHEVNGEKYNRCWCALGGYGSDCSGGGRI